MVSNELRATRWPLTTGQIASLAVRGFIGLPITRDRPSDAHSPINVNGNPSPNVGEWHEECAALPAA